MKRLTTLSLSLLSTLFIPLSAYAIAYGELDNGTHPNVGSLIGVMLNAENETIGNGQCSGTLVKLTNTHAYILTAAHCAKTWFDGNSYAIGITFVDSIPQYNDPQLYIHTKPLMIVHPTYRLNGGGESFDSDIAFLVFDKTQVPGIENLTPAQIIGPHVLANLKAANQLKGTTLTAVGYGNLELFNVGPNPGGGLGFNDDATRRVGYPVINALQSEHVLSSMNPIHEDSGTCFGDSGGPQFLNGVIATITSTGDFACRASDRSYRLDLPSSQSFINCVLDPDKTTFSQLATCGTSKAL